MAEENLTINNNELTPKKNVTVARSESFGPLKFRKSCGEILLSRLQKVSTFQTRLNCGTCVLTSVKMMYG